jgi:hypothetical protein
MTMDVDAPSTSDIFGFSDAHVYCSARKRKFFRKIDQQWRPFNNGIPEVELNAIGGTAPDDLYVLGSNGAVFHHDGTRWSEMDTPTDVTLNRVLAPARQEAYFSGRQGSFFHLRNSAWEDLSLDDEEIHLRGIASYRNQIYVGSHRLELFALRGDALLPVATDIQASLRVIGDRLCAFGNQVVQQFDGTAWTTREFDFGSIIPPPA